MSGDRASGYVTEIEYTGGFYPELGPVRLGFAAQAAGLGGPDPGLPFTYLELGCGQGRSTALHAASLPHGRFFAADLNPAHIRNARAFSESAGLANVTWLERSFAELLDEDLPDLDFITLQGVYSWISAENRRHVAELVRRRLKPGGLVYLSYNALPGWTAAAPLRRLMADHAALGTGPLEGRIRDAVGFASALRDAGARYFERNPAAASRLDQIAEKSPAYLAHEYFNRDWTLFYFADVAAEMAEAGLGFAGSAHLMDRVEALTIPAAARPALAGIHDPTFRETAKDFITGQPFRRDVFVRPGARPVPDPVLALVTPREACPGRVAVPAGDFRMEGAIHGTVLDTLAGEPQPLSSLLALPALAERGHGLGLEAVMTLVGLDLIGPALPRAGLPGRLASTRRFNAAMLDRQRAGLESSVHLASPVLGTGIEVNLLEGLTLSAWRDGAGDPARFVWNVLAGRGQRLVKDGRTLESEAGNLTEIAERIEAFAAGRLLVLSQLGVAE